MSNIQKGKYGEELAADFLIKSGYKIIDKNYKFSRYGEIDIIALEKDTLCFIEVKTRTNNNFGSGLEAVTKEKLMKITACIQKYIQDTKIKFKNYRIDVISIELKNLKPEITYIKNIGAD